MQIDYRYDNQTLFITAFKQHDIYDIEIEAPGKERPSDVTINLLAENILKNQVFGTLHTTENIKGKVKAGSIYTWITDIPKKIVHLIAYVLRIDSKYHLIDEKKLASLKEDLSKRIEEITSNNTFLDIEILNQINDLQKIDISIIERYHTILDALSPANLKLRNEAISKLVDEDLNKKDFDPSQVDAWVTDAFAYIGAQRPDTMPKVVAQADQVEAQFQEEEKRRKDLLAKYKIENLDFIDLEVSKKHFDSLITFYEIRDTHFLDLEIYNELHELEKNLESLAIHDLVDKLSILMTPENLKLRNEALSELIGEDLQKQDDPGDVDATVSDIYAYIGRERPASLSEVVATAKEVDKLYWFENKRRKDLVENRDELFDLKITKKHFDAIMKLFVLLDRENYEFLDKEINDELFYLKDNYSLDDFDERVEKLSKLMDDYNLEIRTKVFSELTSLKLNEEDSGIDPDYVHDRVIMFYSFIGMEKPSNQFIIENYQNHINQFKDEIKRREQILQGLSITDKALLDVKVSRIDFNQQTYKK